MAKASYKMPEDFLLRLSRLGDKTDSIIEKVLDTGGSVVESKVRSNLQANIGNNLKEDGRSTGQLISALGVSSAKQDSNGDFNVKVGFAEPRSDGTRNAMIASVLEYGKHGQPQKPFIKPAKSASKSAAHAALPSPFVGEVDQR